MGCCFIVTCDSVFTMNYGERGESVRVERVNGVVELNDLVIFFYFFWFFFFSISDHISLILLHCWERLLD